MIRFPDHETSPLKRRNYPEFSSYFNELWRILGNGHGDDRSTVDGAGSGDTDMINGSESGGVPPPACQKRTQDRNVGCGRWSRMRFHEYRFFSFLRRRRGAIPTAAALAVSPGPVHRYLEQERRIRRQIFLPAGSCFWSCFLFPGRVSARIGILNDFIFSSPSRVLSCFLSMAADRTIFYHTGSHGSWRRC